MRLSPARRRLVALAAMLGIALQALWPLVAQARSGRSIAVPICSAGVSHRSVELPIDGGKSGQVAGHCKLCLLGGDRPAVSNPLAAFLLPGLSAEAVLQAAQDRFVPPARVAAHPRAPPAFL